MNIVLVGCGALGSHVALLMRNCAHTIRLVDFDRVEHKNLLGQFHTKMGLGKNKTQTLQQTLNGLFGVKVEAIPHKLTKDNVTQLLGDSGLVLDCTDNREARNLIQGFVREHKVPCLHGGLSADGTFGRVMWDEMFVADQETQGVATCESGEALPFFALTAAQLVCTVQEFLRSGQKKSFQLTPNGIIRIG